MSAKRRRKLQLRLKLIEAVLFGAIDGCSMSRDESGVLRFHIPEPSIERIYELATGAKIKDGCFTEPEDVT